MYSHVASHHPMSVEDERINTSQKTEGSEVKLYCNYIFIIG